VSGLDASQTRVLTVTYLYDSNQGFMGASQMATIVPLLLWVGIICLVIGLGMAIFKKDDQIECLKAWAHTEEDAMRVWRPLQNYWLSKHFYI